MTKASSDAAVPLLIEAGSISEGYAHLLVQIMDHSGKEVAPLVLSISGFGPNGDIPENSALRSALDTALARHGFIEVEDVAFTIFPQRFWLMAGGDRAKLFRFYARAFPFFKKRNPKANGRGLYFERLTAYGRGPCEGNQLEWILTQFESRSGVRDSMFQATTFDPERDHNATAQLGFPCLQQISFVPTKTGLVVNAFYATQQVFDKAYGNYLGLAQLGAFMAHEMGLPFARLNVTVGVAKLERVTKSDQVLIPLVAAARDLVGAAPVPIALSA